MSEDRAVVAVVLAAGLGKRMKSDRPKVLHEVCGLPMLTYVLEALRDAGVDDVVVVVGHAAETVRERFAAWEPPLRWVEQTERRGTGHAVMVTGETLRDFDGDVVVVCGDNPLLSGQSVREAIARHRHEGAACTVVTAEVDDPTGYGRIVRNVEGDVEAIVEERDTTDGQKRIREINSGNYVFDARGLFDALGKIRPTNEQGEYYLTDVVAAMRSDGQRVLSHITSDPTEVLGINSRAQLAEAGRILQARVRARLMEAGVTIIDPASTFIDPRVEVGRDTVIGPFTIISGPTRIGRECLVGPFVHVRSGTELPDGSQTGSFKEFGA
ncbi:MAG TPA: sugar phosphate nucleotidyltransferase [Planctomycetota bacterium]|nr:sugar phosphate nucleotidyltransferase [Planctomycetota bacterium]